MKHHRASVNAKIKALDKYTGDVLWSYDYESPKFNGKGQRAKLLISENKLLCSFASGGFINLSADDGKVVNSVKNKRNNRGSFFTWSPIKVCKVFKLKNKLFLTQS